MHEETVSRVRTEVELLAEEIGGLGPDKDRIKLGKVTVASREYIGVLIENLSVNPVRFNNVKSVRALVLLPSEYPRTPPLGVYVNRRLQAATRHFVGQGVHGAPDLVQQGWYWFCHGIGGFGANRQIIWRPAPNPQQGDNLCTVVAAARVYMNSAH